MTKHAENELQSKTEDRILSAAEHEFMSKGFAGARTTSIAEAAGVTHAMFHYYFRTKEKLFERIIFEKMTLLQQLIMDSFSDFSQPLNVLLQNLINLHIDFISANPELPRFLITEVFGKPEQLNFFFEKIMNIAPNLFSRLQLKIDETSTQGICRKVDAKMLVLDIVSLNLFPFVASPLVDKVFNNNVGDHSDFIERRKKENYDTIMRKLRP